MRIYSFNIYSSFLLVLLSIPQGQESSRQIPDYFTARTPNVFWAPQSNVLMRLESEQRLLSREAECKVLYLVAHFMEEAAWF